MARSAWALEPDCLVGIPALPLSSCVALNKHVYPSVPA